MSKKSNTLAATTAPAAPKSIRALVRASLLAGASRESIAADIAEFFPNTRAAAKSSVHISWYAGRLRKEGFNVPKVTPVRKATEVAVSA